jgi:hypothetical protein
LTEVAESCGLLFEEMDVLSQPRVIAKREVATDELHVADLSSFEVMEHPVVVPVIVVAKRLTLLAGDDDDERDFTRSEDAALPLKLRRPIPFAVEPVTAIDTATLEHRLDSRCACLCPGVSPTDAAGAYRAEGARRRRPRPTVVPFRSEDPVSPSAGPTPPETRGGRAVACSVLRAGVESPVVVVVAEIPRLMR